MIARTRGIHRGRAEIVLALIGTGKVQRPKKATVHLAEDETDDMDIDMKEEDSFTESEDDKEAMRDLYVSNFEDPDEGAGGGQLPPTKGRQGEATRDEGVYASVTSATASVSPSSSIKLPPRRPKGDKPSPGSYLSRSLIASTHHHHPRDDSMSSKVWIDSGAPISMISRPCFKRYFSAHTST